MRAEQGADVEWNIVAILCSWEKSRDELISTKYKWMHCSCVGVKMWLVQSSIRAQTKIDITNVSYFMSFGSLHRNKCVLYA